MSSSLRRWILQGAAWVAICIWIGTHVSVGESLRRLGAMPLWVGLVGLGLEWAFYAVESLRNRMFLGKGYPVLQIFRSRLLAAALGNCLPGLGAAEIVRIFVLDRLRPGNKVRVTLTLLGSRLYGLLGLLALVAIRRPELSLLVFLPLGFGLRRVRLLVAALRPHLPRVLRSLYRRMYLSLRLLVDPRSWFVGILTSMATAAMIIGAHIVLAHQLGISIPLQDWFWVVPWVSLAAFVPVGIGAVGPQDAAWVMMAKQLSIPVESALALSLGIHAFRILGSLPGFVFWNDLWEIPALRRWMARFQRA